MRKLIMIFVLVLSCASANAYVQLGETYTGKTSVRANDFTLNEVPQDGEGFLGGQIVTAAYNKVSRQFTVSEFSTAHYLSISGLLTPKPEYLGPFAMNVDFAIIKGSDPFPPGSQNFKEIPTNNVLSTGKYKFSDLQFSNIFIPLSPFDTPLEPNQDYWVKASTSDFNGSKLEFETKLYGEVTTPEPTTFLLLGGGLIAAFRRRGAKR